MSDPSQRSTAPRALTTSPKSSATTPNQKCSRTRRKLPTFPMGLFLALGCSSLLLSSVHSFNVDVNSKVVHSGPRGACDQDCMFGFAVAQHREAGTPWLLVGAPTAESGQPGVTKGGAVYRCKPDNPGSCDQIPFDINGNTMATTGQQYDKKSGQWFGSLVQSSGEDGIILACAPRYIWYSRNFARREPIGTCYTARNNFADFSEYSPCRTNTDGLLIHTRHDGNSLLLDPPSPFILSPRPPS